VKENIRVVAFVFRRVSCLSASRGPHSDILMEAAYAISADWNWHFLRTSEKQIVTKAETETHRIAILKWRFFLKKIEFLRFRRGAITPPICWDVVSRHWTTGARRFDRVVVSGSLGDRCPTFRQSGGGLIYKGREDQEEWLHGLFDHLKWAQ